MNCTVNHEDWLWTLACNEAKGSRFLKGMCYISIIMFLVILSFGLQYVLIIGLWNWGEALNYVAISFIAWAGIVHLSDRLSTGEKKTIALSKTKTEGHLNMDSMVHLAMKKKLGIISLIFLILGLFSEAASQVIAT